MASSSSGRACTRACDLLRDGETLNSMCQQRSRTGLESRAGGCQCPRACLTVVEQVRWSCAGAARVVQSRKYCYRRVYQGGLMKGDPPCVIHLVHPALLCLRPTSNCTIPLPPLSTTRAAQPLSQHITLTPTSLHAICLARISFVRFPFRITLPFPFNFPARLPVLLLHPLVSKPPPPSYSIRVSFVCLW